MLPFPESDDPDADPDAMVAFNCASDCVDVVVVFVFDVADVLWQEKIADSLFHFFIFAFSLFLYAGEEAGGFKL